MEMKLTDRTEVTAMVTAMVIVMSTAEVHTSTTAKSARVVMTEERAVRADGLRTARQ